MLLLLVQKNPSEGSMVLSSEGDLQVIVQPIYIYTYFSPPTKVALFLRFQKAPSFHDGMHILIVSPKGTWDPT